MFHRGLGARRARIAASGLAAAVVGAAGLAVTVTGSASVAAGCVTAYPEDTLTRGQTVEGLTVSHGTVPDTFDGTISGVLQDGIAPGIDLILAELDSPAINEKGIWAGMSGSPVYADPGGRTQLVGAVSYTLNSGATTLAGITPASAMLDLIPAPAATTIALPRKVQDSLVAEGVATPTEAASGLRRLPTRIGISGLSQKRFDQLAGWLDGEGPVTLAANGSSTSAAESDIVPGGNVAASLGWGYVSAAAVGTVTEVCGDDVVAFGHPFNYTGSSTYSLHPAEAVEIVGGADSFFGGYKLANLGEPVGTISDDHLAGIHGTLSTEATRYDVSSTASYGSKTVSGTTHVTVADLVSDAGLANAFTASDRALDKYGKGSATASWTILGKRRNGTPFQLTHSDVYTDAYDIASAPLMDLAMQAYTLLGNQGEAVTITGITTNTTFSDDATSWRIGRTFYRSNGAWKRITSTSPAVVRAGRTSNIRVELYSRDADPKYVTVPVTPSKRSAGRLARLSLNGGSSSNEDYFFFDSDEAFIDYYEDSFIGGAAPKTIPEVIKALQNEQKNDTVATTFRVRGTTTKKGSIDLGQVVSGSVLVPIRVRP